MLRLKQLIKFYLPWGAIFNEKFKVMCHKPVPLTDKTEPFFTSRLYPGEKDLQLQLLQLFSEATENNFLLAYGSLLGSLLYKGFIPWDDDIDVFCFYEDYDSIRKKCLKSGKLKWFDFYRRQYLTSKVFLPNGPYLDRDGKFSWPYIDILWLKNHSEDYFYDSSNFIFYKKSDIFPITEGQFEGRQYPCPSQAATILQQRHPECFSYAFPSDFDHRGLPLPMKKCLKVKLEDLAALYPILNTTLPKFSKR